MYSHAYFLQSCKSLVIFSFYKKEYGSDTEKSQLFAYSNDLFIYGCEKALAK